MVILQKEGLPVRCHPQPFYLRVDVYRCCPASEIPSPSLSQPGVHGCCGRSGTDILHGATRFSGPGRAVQDYASAIRFPVQTYGTPVPHSGVA
eukprot:1368554-Rhodomonas_salina.1